MADAGAPRGLAGRLRRTAGRLGGLLAEQGRRSREIAGGIRPARGLMVLYGMLVAAGVVVLAGFVPLLVERVLVHIPDEFAVMFFSAWMMALLAQAALVYLVSVLLAYVTAELFAPRDRIRLVGARGTIWNSLHRLGNTTSITLVLAVAGTAVGIVVFGPLLSEMLTDDGFVDTPGELAGIQLGTLLFVLMIALLYESVRVVVELLGALPGLWRWTSAYVYPWVAAVIVWLLFPTFPTLMRIFDQWLPPGANPDIELVGDTWDPGLALLMFLVLWAGCLVNSGQVRRLRAALRA